MDTKNTYRIADIFFGDTTQDSFFEFDYLGKHFEVQRFSASYSIPYFRDLITNLRNDVDAFGISGLPPVMRIQGKTYVHRQYLEIMSLPSSAPLCDGSVVREICLLSGVARGILDGRIEPERGIFFPLALYYLELVRYLGDKHADKIACGDPYSIFGTSWLGTPNVAWVTIARLALWYATMKDLGGFTPMKRTAARTRARDEMLAKIGDYKYIMGDLGVLNLLGPDLGFVRGKDVLLAAGNAELEQKLLHDGASSVHNLFPEALRFHPSMAYSVLDATLRLAHNRTAQLSVQEWQTLLAEAISVPEDVRKYLLDSKPSKQVTLSTSLQRARAIVKQEAPPDFAFVVHALSQEDLFRVPGLGALGNMPGKWKDSFEVLASKLPGFTYGRVKGIISKKNNREVNGIIYALSATPKMMRATEPDVFYRRIETLSQHAADLGAKILGLGAYTKIIGDAGESINRFSPIPVTTGNSLSASATLWSVAEVIHKMGLVRFLPGTQIVDGTATIIGATGSIGKVSAKLLGLMTKKIVLVAPRLARLEELAAEIRLIAPHCEVTVTTNANDFAAQTDVLVTATSALDQKVVDVELLKPGCIVCDCSRPLDFTTQDALKRPDILIIESGEVVLPGPAKITCDIGLPRNVVYACLGETALLAMEGMYEPFTLGREIDYLKVKRIYRLAKEHGVQLAAVRGHMGLITDREIALTRELALKRLGAQRA